MELFLGKKNSAKNMDVSQKIKNNSKMEKDIKIVQEELKKFIYFEFLQSVFPYNYIY